MYEFALTQPVTVAVKLTSGLLEIAAEERDSATVDVLPWDDSAAAREAAERVHVELVGDRLTVETPTGLAGARWVFGRSSRVRIAVRTPLDSPLEVRAASVDVRCRGRFGTSSLHSASGDVQIEEVAGDLHADLASGDLSAERVAGQANAKSASGDINIGTIAGDLVAGTASGDIRVGRGDASVAARTASGNVVIDMVRQGEVKVNSASGDVQIGVLRGTGVWLDLNTTSGRTTSELDFADAQPAPAAESGGQVSLRVRTVSGDIQVRRATAAPAA